MKKLTVLAITSILYFTPTFAEAQEAVASFNIPYRAVAGSAPRALVAGAKLSDKLSKQQCKLAGKELQLRLKAVIGSIDSIVISTEHEGKRVYVTEGVVTGACVRK